MRWDIVAFFGIAAALMLGTILAVFVSTIFFESRDESKLLNPDGSLATMYPSLSPTIAPSLDPTGSPSNQPSAFPTSWPSMNPTESTSPTSSPSSSPSSLPSMQPTLSAMPSAHPSLSPTISSEPSAQPSMSPTMSSQPSSMPSSQPTSVPSSQPSTNPTLSASPSSKPSQQPTISTSPSSQPSLNPTISTYPSSQPSEQPTLSTSPSTEPSLAPSTSTMPTDSPSSKPSSLPSKHPSATPSLLPTTAPSLSPSNEPSLVPTSEQIVTTTIVLNPGKDQRSTNLVAVGGAYVFVLAGIGYYLFKRDKNARLDDQSEDPSISNTLGDGDIEAGILGIAPPPPVVEKTTPAKSVSKRILSPLKNFSSVRTLSPFKGFRSLRGNKLEAGGSLSISSGDSDVIPAIQESCSLDSSDAEDKDSLPSEEVSTGKKSEKIADSSHPNTSVANAPRDSLDALMEDFNQKHDEVGQMEAAMPASNVDQIGSVSKTPRLAYEEQLINSRKNADFSFRDIFFDPENELYECRVPSGRLGIVVDETGIGPRVEKINIMSKLYKKISVGDIIVAVDEVDLVGAKPDTFWQIVSRKANKQERCIVVLKI
mmetsp:Transcript_6368/g.13406  ORF Transcript_6368/g.13406 Transcript_6368/m.13406 type:complete len:595 (-) Transcript_6368:117-1901(-)